MRHVALLSLLLIVAGCASTNQYPNDPNEQINFHMRYAGEYAAEKKYGTVAYHLNEMLTKPGGPERVKVLLATDTDMRVGLVRYLCQADDAIESKENLIRSIRLARELDERKLWDGMPGCSLRLDSLAIGSKKFKWTVEDDAFVFDSLATEPQQLQLMQDSMAYYQAKSRYLASPKGAFHDMASRYADYVDKLEQAGKIDRVATARVAITRTYCAAIPTVSDNESILGLMQSMVIFRQRQPKGGVEACIDELDRAAATHFAVENQQISLVDDTSAFKSLSTPEMQLRLALNTLSLIREGDKKESAREALTKYLAGLQRGTVEYLGIQKHLQVNDYPPRVLKILEPYFSDVVGAKLHELRTGMKLQAATQNQAITSMLEGCAGIADSQKKAACFESVMDISKKAQGASSGALYTKFDGIKRAAVALKSATDVGVTLIQYMPYVQQLATEVQVVKAMSNTKYEQEALSYYDKAIAAYRDAHTFWDAWIDFYSRRDNKTTYFGGLPYSLTNVGWIVQKYAIPTTNADLLGFNRGVTQSAAMRVIWRKADEYVQAANDEL